MLQLIWKDNFKPTFSVTLWTILIMLRRDLNPRLCDMESALSTRPGVHNSNLTAGQNFLLSIPTGQNCMFLPIRRVHSTRKQAKSTKFWPYRDKSKASAGHIWPAGHMLCMPALDYAISHILNECWYAKTLPFPS